jgi:erythromycin esterase-like protein
MNRPSLPTIPRTAAALVLVLIVGGGLAPLSAQRTLPELLRENRHPMSLDAEGRLTGAGAELLLSAGRDAQFFLIGEEHGVAEIPAISAALFRALVGHGYRHLAIETGDALAAALNRALLQDETGAAYLAFLREHWPGAPFYFWQEDAALLRAAVDAAGRRPDVLWGLDYDIVADRYTLRRLRDLAPDPAARAAAEATIARADSALEQAMAQQNPGLLFMFGGPVEVYPALRTAYAPTQDSEAGRILHLMEETRAINQLFMTGQGYESNHRRALLSKQRFARYLDEAREASGGLPRVMLKFGASHMVRGRSFTNVFDLGTLASELAEAEGGHSFGVLMLGGAGTQHAVVDPRVMRSSPAPIQVAEWAAPFHEEVQPDGWTVYDLRPLRVHAPRLGALPDELRRVLYGFDAVVILAGSGPQHDLPLR